MVGDVSPMPTLPLSRMEKRGACELLVVWKLMPVPVPAPCTESFAKGLVVLMPTLPVLFK